MYFVLKLSKLCNLRCTYCYEFDELGDATRMPLEGLDTLFAGAAEHLAARGGDARLVLHGGEPALLPADYLRGVVERARSRLGGRGVPFRVSMQTNLTRADDGLLALLDELDVSLGVSVDVLGGERRDAGGRDANARALANLQRLFDTGTVARRHVGAISVLHAGNVEDALGVFSFYDALGLDYRILPLFSVHEPPERVRHLLVSHERVVDALLSVAAAMLARGSRIRVYPLWNHLCAAVNRIAGIEERIYVPGRDEWAVVVNTNGDAYTHGDAYTPDGFLGNAFETPLGSLLRGPRHIHTVAVRAARAATCDACDYGRSCSRIPLVEALASERGEGPQGELACPVARPVIVQLEEWLRASPRVDRYLAEVRKAQSPVVTARM